jgi:hypothetical protein
MGLLELYIEAHRLGQHTRILVRVSVRYCLLLVSFPLIALSSAAVSYHRTSTGERLAITLFSPNLKPDGS